MAKRAPLSPNHLYTAGLACIVLSLVALGVALWQATISDQGRVTVAFSVSMGLFAGLCILGSVQAVVAARRSRGSQAGAPEVEVVMLRNPHDVSEVAVFIDGTQVPVDRLHEVDPEIEPGAYTVEEWREMAEEAVAAEPGGSQAWSAQVRAWYVDTEGVLREDD